MQAGENNPLKDSRKKHLRRRMKQIQKKKKIVKEVERKNCSLAWHESETLFLGTD